jgi:hypothetical protein
MNHYESTDQFLWEVHRYTNEYIRFADTKAAFIAVTVTALIGGLVSSSILDSCFREGPCLWHPLQWLGLIGLTLLTASLILSIIAIQPRLWNDAEIGYIFWESVALHGTRQKFSNAARELTSQDRTTQISDHLYTLASVAKRKFHYVKLAIYTGFGGGLLTGIVLFLEHALH